MFKLQRSVFYNLEALLQTSAFYRKYYLIFKSLNLTGVHDKNTGAGCTGYSRHAFIRAFIVKHLERIKSIPKLLEFLDAHPVLTEMCGFIPASLPDDTCFYRFLYQINTSQIENIHFPINKYLIKKDVISLTHFLIDSKPVMAATKENNFKNPKRNTRNKKKKPKRNPNAALGYYSYQKVNGKKDNFIFFWGYRTHAIVSKEGIPLVTATLPNDHSDGKVAKKLIKKLKRVYRFKKGAFFIADAAYDERAVYNLIVDKMKCKAFIPINPRNTKNDKVFSRKGIPLCEAGLEMKSAGSWQEGSRKRLKFRCPLKTDKSVAASHPDGCPVNNPRFNTGKAYGCTKYLDITNDARSQVPRNSKFYKKNYSLRTEVERCFARLGDREVDKTTHYKIKSVKNQMAIAHLSMSLVAYAASILIQQPEKIRCYSTFADDWIPDQFRLAA